MISMCFVEQTILRMMDNCSLDTERVKTIQDDLNYYVDNNEDPDFYENEMMYDDLDLEEVQSTVFPATGEGGGGGGGGVDGVRGGLHLEECRVQCSLQQVRGEGGGEGVRGGLHLEEVQSTVFLATGEGEGVRGGLHLEEVQSIVFPARGGGGWVGSEEGCTWRRCRVQCSLRGGGGGWVGSEDGCTWRRCRVQYSLQQVRGEGAGEVSAGGEVDGVRGGLHLEVVFPATDEREGQRKAAPGGGVECNVPCQESREEGVGRWEEGVWSSCRDAGLAVMMHVSIPVQFLVGVLPIRPMMCWHPQRTSRTLYPTPLAQPIRARGLSRQRHPLL